MQKKHSQSFNTDRKINKFKISVISMSKMKINHKKKNKDKISTIFLMTLKTVILGTIKNLNNRMTNNIKINSTIKIIKKIHNSLLFNLIKNSLKWLNKFSQNITIRNNFNNQIQIINLNQMKIKLFLSRRNNLIKKRERMIKKTKG